MAAAAGAIAMASGMHGAGREFRMRDPVTAPMKIQQAAEYLGTSVSTLYRLAAAGLVPGFKVGSGWRFRKSHLDKWMDEKSGKAAGRG